MGDHKHDLFEIKVKSFILLCIGGANERNSSGRAHNTSSNCTKIDGNINKDDLKSNEGNSSILNSNLDKPKGGNEDKGKV